MNLCEWIFGGPSHFILNISFVVFGRLHTKRSSEDCSVVSAKGQKKARRTLALRAKSVTILLHLGHRHRLFGGENLGLPSQVDPQRMAIFNLK